MTLLFMEMLSADVGAFLAAHKVFCKKNLIASCVLGITIWVSKNKHL